jgi:hypothetical protein
MQNSKSQTLFKIADMTSKKAVVVPSTGGRVVKETTLFWSDRIQSATEWEEFTSKNDVELYSAQPVSIMLRSDRRVSSPISSLAECGLAMPPSEPRISSPPCATSARKRRRDRICA